MKATRYFTEQVMRKRPYLTAAMCEAVLAAPILRVDQIDGRVRFWGPARLPDDDKPRILRVITLADGETVHNAFMDRDFQVEDE